MHMKILFKNLMRIKDVKRSLSNGVRWKFVGI